MPNAQQVHWQKYAPDNLQQADKNKFPKLVTYYYYWQNDKVEGNSQKDT